MLTGGLVLSRPLVIIWLAPAALALLLLIASGDASPTARARALVGLRLLVAAYLAGAVVLTLWPLSFDLSVARVEDGNWTPFEGTIGFALSSHPLRAEIGQRDVLANVVMFLPLGALVPYAFFRWRGIVLALSLLAALAFGLELVQGLLVAQRTFDIDDAIAGFGGAVLGACLAALVAPLARRRG